MNRLNTGLVSAAVAGTCLVLSSLFVPSGPVWAQTAKAPASADIPTLDLTQDAGVADAAIGAEADAALDPAQADAGTAEPIAEVTSEEEDVVDENPEAAPKLTPEERVFVHDIAALVSGSHRLAGSDEGARAGAYILSRLQSMGLEDVLPLDMPTWQTTTASCEIEVDGAKARLYPLRPNVIVPPSTPPEGLDGPFIYARRGALSDYGARKVEGAIVALDYDSFDNWERAFALGASAVVFIGKGNEVPVQPKVAGVPSNLIRLYAPASELGGVDLRRDHARVHLQSTVNWEKRRGRNLIARIRGTDPTFVPDRKEAEALVLATSYDSFGVVPERSPDARGAANVAALLEAVKNIKLSPPKRDVIFMFLDNQARAHQGAREVYNALMLSGDEATRVKTEHEKELKHVRAMRTVLEKSSLGFADEQRGGVDGVSVAVWLKRELAKQSDHARDDVRKRLQKLRLSSASTEPEKQALLDAEALRWDEVRRALHEGTLKAFYDGTLEKIRVQGPDAASAKKYLPLFETLVSDTLAHFDLRLSELEAELEFDRQREELRTRFGFRGAESSTAIVLHTSFSFGDSGSTWGVVVGDWTNRLFPWRLPRSEGDTPGYYGRVLNAFSDVAGPAGSKAASHLDLHSLSDPTLGLTFAPRPFVTSGTVAGSYGLYNVSLMTGYDARVKDGHPADTLGRLHWQVIRNQALEATTLMRKLASSAGISLPSVFKGFAKTKLPSWNDGQSAGDYAGLIVSGNMAEDRPASGAMMALWPGSVDWIRQAWTSLADALVTPNFDPIALEPVDENGRFRVIALREDMHEQVMALGALFDGNGGLLAISTTDKQAQKLVDSMRANLFFARGGHFTSIRSYETKPELFKVLKASSDALFRDNRSLWGQLQNQGFFYISDQVADYRLKLFQPMGPVVLGEFTKKLPFGNGLAPESFKFGESVSRDSAFDLWRLNESRLDKLRSRGVTSADLELLHSRARRAFDEAEASATVPEREAALSRSVSLSQRVYQPLRTTMDDLVHAIVMLLLLAIPFAFSMERLLICATGIYGRIAGFTAMFLATFGLLYWLHPGFAIATTPIIIFLAFAIVLLSSLVTYIVARKFKTELRAIQGQGTGLHDLEVSRMGTMLAAVGMGMSTMRRRPTRTFLTALTVVMLTFTILSFASFSRTVGVRSIYEGPVGDQTSAGLLIRKLDYSPLAPGVMDMLRGEEGAGGMIAGHYWLVRKDSTAPRLSIARVDNGESLLIDAVLGLPVDELDRWPALGQSLGAGELAAKKATLNKNGVYLPSIVQEVLRLVPGTDVLLNGKRVRFAGAIDASALQRLRHLDNQSLLPVDFQDPTAASTGAAQTQQNDNEQLLVSEVDRDFVHLSADQVAVASAELVQSLGGNLHSITVHPGDGVNVVERGRRVAELVVMPVWTAAPEGVERLILTVLTEVSGGLALFVPLLLGGLIIFGTLLGSISDREREIYTFSALGLSPGHVGVLFFAEATVYAVVGGMGGQLLAQCVGLAASWLARAGYIQPTSINYSSTNSMFAIGVVMATVLVSAIYPAVRASKSANPGLARGWKMPPAQGDTIKLTFPFTVSAYDITGVVSFLAEHFRRHDDAGLGNFAASNVEIRENDDGNLELSTELALAPFDLGVTENMTLTAIASEIEGVDEVAIEIRRQSGAAGDWHRANRVFLRDLRRQFLLWRTLSADHIEHYRKDTLVLLGELRGRRPTNPGPRPPAASGGAA